MRYKLYDNSSNDIHGDIVGTVLKNRGIENGREYLGLTSNVVQPYSYLDNMNMAVQTFMNHYSKEHEISIMVDSDPDGYCSAAMIYQYIKKLNSNYPINYLVHKTVKNHHMDDVDIPETTKLLIVPDAGTNEVEACKRLSEDMDIIILDHHKKEDENLYAIIINNQMSERYTNKQLCGAGVVYRFLQALDDLMWNEYADDFLDLCALANISDNMDIRSYETKYLIDCGLKNINNKFLKAMIKAQDYSMKGTVSIHNIQWYVTPVINGMIRMGTYEERELLFRAFIETDEIFDYKKRGETVPIKEDIYSRAARLCKNAKAKQDKKKQSLAKELLESIKEKTSDKKFILFNTTGMVDRGLTGIVAIQVANMFKKPCILVQERIVTSDNGSQKIILAGSARNYNNSPIKSLINFTKDCNEFISCKGHDNAFGVELEIENFNKAYEALEKQAENITFDDCVEVDYIINFDDCCSDDLKYLTYQLSELDAVIGTGIEEPVIVVESMLFNKDDFRIVGKNEDTISFAWDDVKFVQFKCQPNNELYNWLQNSDFDKIENESVSITLIGKPSISDYKGVLAPQIIITDVMVDNEDKW